MHDAVPQHTDSTQCPLVQSPSILHVVPSGPPELELVLVLELLLVLELVPELELVLVLEVVLEELELPLMLPPAPPHVTRSPQSDESW